MNRQTVNGWILFSLLLTTLAHSYPQVTSSQIAAQYLPVVKHPVNNYNYQQQSLSNNEQFNERKFAEKPNALKKVALEDIDEEIETNQIQDNTFSWTNMIGTLMQMFFNNANMIGPNKSDDLEPNPNFTPSPWTNVISVGLKIITTLLGGGAVNDGIDKVDNGVSSPMQGVLAAVFSSVLGAKDPEQVNIMAKQAGEFINIVVNLLDALKTSFSHRSLAARSKGKSDSVSDISLVGISMLKGYMKSASSTNEKCMQKYVCEANIECNTDVGNFNILCHLGSYLTSYALEKTSKTPFENFYEAGRRGRSGENCKQIYLECNEV